MLNAISNLSIRRKLDLVVLLTTAATLVLAFLVVNYSTARRFRAATSRSRASASS